MPNKTHNNLGEVLATQYLPGAILEVFPEDKDTPAEKWDMARVSVPWGDVLMPIFYHCSQEVDMRANGALVGAADGFDVGDSVVVMGTVPDGKGAEYGALLNPCVVAHKDRPRKCAPAIVAIIITVDGQRWISLFSIRTGKLASFKKPKPPVAEGQPAPADEYYDNPCRYEDAAPILDLFLRKEDGEYVWNDEALFDWETQTPAEGMQIAGGTPNWMDDFQGDIIRNGADPGEWWSTYDYLGNPTYKFFWEAQSGLLTDPAGVAAGTFDKSMGIVGTFNEKGWTGPGVRKDDRSYWVTAAGPAGETQLPASSLHLQVGYGEDEIWVCGRNTYQGMVVSYCDEIWKYYRLENLPGQVDHAGAAIAALAGTAAIATALPGAGAGLALASVGLILAAGMFSSTGGLYCFGTLKRINEGCFHRTSYPTVPETPWLSPGSFKLVQRPIPKDKEETALSVTACNCRLERVNAWVRYDNWMNTLQYSCSVDECDRTWWFRVWATQTMYDNYYLDTPLGTMFYSAPWQRSVLWWMYGLAFRTADLTARQDWPIKTRFWGEARQTSKALCQIYVVHRQGITLWGPQADAQGRFWIQEAIKSPWDCLPNPAELGAPTAPAGAEELNMPPLDSYAGYLSGGTTHISTLAPEQIGALVEPLTFIHSKSTTTPNPLRANRNEIEIMAAADMFGELHEQTGGKRPQDQERNGALEEAIAGVITLALTQAGVIASGFPQFDLEAHII